MAGSSRHSVRNQILDNLSAYERLSFSKRTAFVAKGRQVSADSIQRLENIVTLQENRVRKMRRQSGRSLSETHRQRVAMKDLLATYMLTLQQIRQSAESLELSWSMLE